MIADEFCTEFQGKSSFPYFVGKNRNNSRVMWNCDSFDLQYNRIIRKKQVRKKEQGCMSVNDLPKLIKEYGKDITFINKK